MAKIPYIYPSNPISPSLPDCGILSLTMAAPLDPNDLVTLEELTIDDNPKEVRGKHFRIVGRLKADGVDISDQLIQRNLAVSYDGGTKTKDWCG